MVKNPCMSCPKAGCGVYHDKCPEYQAFRKSKLDDYERRRITSDLRYDLGRNTIRHLKASDKFKSKP